jgi:hypothetical protein
MNDHPIRLTLSDQLERNRLTVFFRLLLALPHFIWLALWGIVALLAAIANWIVTLVDGQPVRALHSFLSRYVRYIVHVYGYTYLVANPYPRFTGAPGYPVDVLFAPPARQNRWTVAFRLILAVPAIMLGAALEQSRVGAGGFNYSLSLLAVTAMLAWFVSLVRGRTSRGLRDAGAYALAYGAQLSAYLFVLTDRYPNSDPQAALADLPLRTDPVSLEVGDDLRRSRLTVFFRLLLALPHLIWLALWGIVALLAAIANWLATLVRASSPAPLHRFLAAFVRYQTHVYAYLYLVGNPFPGFTGAPDRYPIDLQVAGPQPQNRWSVLFRLPLAIPAYLVLSAYSGVLTVVAILAWFAGLVTARMPLGLRNAGALALRYAGQTSAYLFLLTGAYPYSGPCAAPAGPAAVPLAPLDASGSAAAPPPPPPAGPPEPPPPPTAPA